MAPLAVSSARRAALAPLKASPLAAASAECGQKEDCEEEQEEQESSTTNSDPASSRMSMLPPQSNPVTISDTHSPHPKHIRDRQLPEVMCVFCVSIGANLNS